MGANKIGSYIVHYRSKKKEAAEQEKQRRIEAEKSRPAIVDPSFELFCYKTPPTDQVYDDPFKHDTDTTPLALSNDDWLFQNRRATTMPLDYQFEPYCEVTPKSSVSSNNSTASDALSSPESAMGWGSSTTVRPRPQSYLPSLASASHSFSMPDLHRGSEHRSRRHSSQPNAPQQPNSYGLGASLTRPFSIDDPLEVLSEPIGNSHHYHQLVTQEDNRLEQIPENEAS